MGSHSNQEACSLPANLLEPPVVVNMTTNLDGRKPCCMRLQRLALLLLKGVKLHKSLCQLRPVYQQTSGMQELISQQHVESIT
jgi:hypothetical protein